MKLNKQKQPVRSEHPINYHREFILLFSNKKSLFSSKKIERTIVFFVFLIITLIYLWLNIRTLKSLEFVQIIGLWLTYGGYNSLMGYRDKKLDSNGFNDYEYNANSNQGHGYGNQFRNEMQENEENQNNPENQGD